MKRTILLTLGLVIVMSLVACGNKDNKQTETQPLETVEITKPAEETTEAAGVPIHETMEREVISEMEPAEPGGLMVEGSNGEYVVIASGMGLDDIEDPVARENYAKLLGIDTSDNKEDSTEAETETSTEESESADTSVASESLTEEEESVALEEAKEAINDAYTDQTLSEEEYDNMQSQIDDFTEQQANEWRSQVDWMN